MGGRAGFAMAPPDNEWISSEQAALRIGEAWLLQAWRAGTLRRGPREVIATEALRIGATKLNQASREGMLPTLGVKHGTDKEVAVPGLEQRRLILDCRSKCWVRLSNRGRRRLTEYHSVKVSLAVVERLEGEATPPAKQPEDIKREREKPETRVEAARIWKEIGERVRGRAERSAEFERIWGEKKAEKARREKEEAERAAEQRAREDEEAARVEAVKRAREPEKEAEEAERAREAMAETPKPPPKHPGGRPRGQPGVAMADAKKLDDFEALFPDEEEAQLLQRLKNDLQGTMTKPSVARRVRAAKAQWHENKEHQEKT